MNEKAKKLYEGITNIDDDLIEDAYAYKERVKPKRIMKRLAAVAACLCLCAGASLPVMAATGNEYGMQYKSHYGCDGGFTHNVSVYSTMPLMERV